MPESNLIIFWFSLLGFNWEPEPRVGDVGSLVDFEIKKCLPMHSYYAQKYDNILCFGLGVYI